MTRIDKSLLDPQRGRHRILLTMLAFVVPVALPALVPIDGWGHLLTQTAGAELDRQVRTNAPETELRLVPANERLIAIEDQVSGPAANALVNNSVKRYPSSAIRYSNGVGKYSNPVGTGRGAIETVSYGIPQFPVDLTMLMTSHDLHAEPTVILVLSVDTNAPRDGVLIAGFETRHLWSQHDFHSDSSNVCVLGNDKAAESCARPPPESALVHLASEATANSAVLRWGAGDARSLGAYFRLQAEPKFIGNARSFEERPKDTSLNHALSVLGSPLAVILLLSAGIAAFIVWAKARTVRKPQADGTATHHHPLKPSEGSESIAEKYAQQARAMSALSEVDRAILSRANTDRLVDCILRNTLPVIGCQHAAVILLDRDVPTRVQTIFVHADNPQTRHSERSNISVDVARFLTSRPEGCSLDNSQDYAFLTPLANRGGKQFFLWPVYWEGNVAAIFAVGLNERTTLNDDKSTYARCFADRLGVALRASALEEEVKLHAQFDSTTSLLNRSAFKDRLSQEIARARREARQFALLFVDLDQFKKINDSVGHAGGDALLEQASRRLKRCLREEDIVARFGGDEFAILLPAIAKGADVAVVAEKLIEQLSKPFTYGGQGHRITASVGICIYPDDGKSVDALFRSADIAMYRTKTEGGGRYAFFEEIINARLLDHVALESDLREALIKDNLKLFFQPQIDLNNGRIIGAEALIRWSHSKRGIIHPAEFISVAEQSGLIEEIGEFVRSTACAQYRSWESDGIAPLRIAVNISSREFRRNDFIARFDDILRESGVRPYCLEFEITESLFLENSTSVESSLKWLHERGIQIAIDDFGTGYSSIAYLKRLPFDTLKLDRAFVKDIGKRDGSEEIVVAIISMAKSLGKTVVAEGVETAEQRDFLIDHGCDAAQGFLWSKPLPAGDFEALARGWKTPPGKLHVVIESA